MLRVQLIRESEVDEQDLSQRGGHWVWFPRRRYGEGSKLGAPGISVLSGKVEMRGASEGGYRERGEESQNSERAGHRQPARKID